MIYFKIILYHIQVHIYIYTKNVGINKWRIKCKTIIINKKYKFGDLTEVKKPQQFIRTCLLHSPSPVHTRGEEIKKWIYENWKVIKCWIIYWKSQILDYTTFVPLQIPIHISIQLYNLWHSKNRPYHVVSCNLSIPLYDIVHQPVSPLF